ncbi:hypothetical protein [Azospirillum sp. sgz302134]
MAEPTTSDILAAIADLKTYMDKRFSAVDAEFGKVRGEMAEFKAEIRGELAEFKAEVRGEFKAVNARLDEQRQTINALIPTRIAAVPPAAE